MSISAYTRYMARIPNKQDWLGPLVAVALALASLLFTGWTSYSQNDKSHEARITALESHRTDDKEKIDHIETQVDKLVEWALGHK